MARRESVRNNVCCTPKISLNSVPKDVFVALSAEKDLECILKEVDNQVYEDRETETNITNSEINKEKGIMDKNDG